MNVVLALVLVALGASPLETPPSKESPKPAAPAASPADADAIRAQKPAYPLEKCVACDHALDAKSVDAVVDGRLLRVCNAECRTHAEKDKTAAIAKVDAAVIAAQKPAYPLTTCAVSGEKLGSKGDAYDVVHGTKLVRLCCKDCKSAFEKDPAAALAKVDKGWIEAQVASYPLDTCAVSDEKLGSMGAVVDVLYGTKLVRLCCKGCKKAVEKDGPALVAKIEAARKK